MDENIQDMLVFLGISTALYGIFATTNINYLWWISGIATIFFSIATLIKAIAVVKKAFK